MGTHASRAGSETTALRPMSSRAPQDHLGLRFPCAAVQPSAVELPSSACLRPTHQQHVHFPAHRQWEGGWRAPHSLLEDPGVEHTSSIPNPLTRICLGRAQLQGSAKWSLQVPGHGVAAEGGGGAVAQRALGRTLLTTPHLGPFSVCGVGPQGCVSLAPRATGSRIRYQKLPGDHVGRLL